MRWTPEMTDFLRANYPAKGKAFCMQSLGMSEAQVRAKASRMGLVARGVSDAWAAKNKAHSELMTGRRRPAQREVMLGLFADGRLSRERTPSQRQAVSVATRRYIAKNGHPRGALGIRHSAETRQAIGEKGRASWEAMSDERRHQRNLKMMQSRVANGTTALERPNASWKAGWREIGGVRKYYRSKWEANYAHYLQWLKDLGQIADWKHEPKTFWFDGVKRGTVSYLPDFWVKENSGAESYHEVKGWMDERSKTKIERMGKFHADVRLVVIDASAYKAIKRTAESIVPGWEA